MKIGQYRTCKYVIGVKFKIWDETEIVELKAFGIDKFTDRVLQCQLQYNRNRRYRPEPQKRIRLSLPSPLR